MRKLERAPVFNPAILSKYASIAGNEAAQKVLSEIHEQYNFWDKVKHKPVGDIPAEDIWMMAKLKRMGGYTHLKFGGYQFRWTVNDMLQGYLHFLDLNIGGSLESTSIVSREDKNRYLISSIMEEAIASSQIEGAATTRQKAKEMLRKNAKPTNKSEQMIMNNYVTIQKILEIKAEPLNKENLLALHKLVTANTMVAASEEGAFRADNDIDVIDAATGEVVHHPPDVVEIDALLNDLYVFFNEDNDDQFIHPLIKGCIIHFMIGYIHPFADGNGRTARALFYWYLLRKGYWLTEYLSISRLILRAKAQYARAYQYTEIDDHDLTYFILFNLKTMKLSFEELRSYIQRKNEEKMKLSNFMKIDSITYKQALILEWFYKEPALMLTSKEAENRLAVSTVAARKNLMHLVEMGYLSLIDLDKKKNGFIRSEKFEELVRSVNTDR
ncbi:MAG: Fic family protein [Chitinophagaceae bacterium]|nr:Fic family protein [Chitinophagaceae bacterium]